MRLTTTAARQTIFVDGVWLSRRTCRISRTPYAFRQARASVSAMTLARSTSG